MLRWTHLERIRRDLTDAILYEFGDSYLWEDGKGEPDTKPIRQYVAMAVKTVLGVPEEESARDGGKFDIPACHHILTRQAATQRDQKIRTGAIDSARSLSRSGCCVADR